VIRCLFQNTPSPSPESSLLATQYSHHFQVFEHGLLVAHASHPGLELQSVSSRFTSSTLLLTNLHLSDEDARAQHSASHRSVSLQRQNKTNRLSVAKLAMLLNTLCLGPGEYGLEPLSGEALRAEQRRLLQGFAYNDEVCFHSFHYFFQLLMC
jgi:hypothetical protein